MQKLMLIGKTGCGKTTLSQAMQGLTLVYRKTQAVSYTDWIVDTPGEFIENRRFYSALLASSTACDVIAFVQDATAPNSIFPPKFATMFNKPAIGIVTKTDLACANGERAEKFLHWAGATTIFHTSSLHQIGITTIIAWLKPGKASLSSRPVAMGPQRATQGVSPRESAE